MVVTYRYTCFEDVPDMIRIDQEAFPGSRHNFVDFTENWINKNDKYRTIGSFADNSLVGMIHLEMCCNFAATKFEKWLFANRRVSNINTIAIDRRYQRQGIGTQLMHLAITLLSIQERPPTHSYLHVHCQNIGAQALYQKMGFEKWSIEPGYYGAWIMNGDRDAYGYVKKLEQPKSLTSKSKKWLSIDLKFVQLLLTVVIWTSLFVEMEFRGPTFYLQ
ncbi:hypothetical protein L596_009466 [Steinernema carpocapsae]|uniref:N-acetyltransferase domain-containing protein n=1 Tax=Steinernema carpocapsae TaxID=34508 RepID=A0A4V6A6Q5_STECR|nr:hypothetical protein L596_009466 [Steinernema carpocapsae]